MHIKNNKIDAKVIRGLVIIIFASIILICVINKIWSWFSSLDANLAASLLTAFSAIVVATLTLVVGRYYERVKEAESHLREKKIQIYDEFLHEFFKILTSEKENKTDGQPSQSAIFSIEWQRKMIIWGGADVLKAFVEWKVFMGSNEPCAKSFYLMDEFLKAMRKDIGLSNKKLDTGFFMHIIMKNSTLFLKMAQENPEIKMSELAEIERKLGLS